MDTNEMSYQSKTLGHLGLVAGMFDELGIGEVVDGVVPQDLERRTLSVGTLVKAMVLNGLGFVNQRLYLVSHFFCDKPVERLLGEGVHEGQLNDDALGRALDDLYHYGVTELYRCIAVQAARRLGLSSKVGHLDSSSFHVDGDYNSDEAPKEDAGVVHITQGYSRDHRPDLNQVVLDLVMENQAGIPLLMKPADGNENDKQGFQSIIQEHLRQLQLDHGIRVIVADSALYSEASLQAMQRQGLYWITRVPATLNEVKQHLQTLELRTFKPLAEGYTYKMLSSHYGGIEQRWLLIYSHEAAQRSAKTVQKRFLRESEVDMKAWQALCKQRFSCAEDAQRALRAFSAKLKRCSLHDTHVITQVRYTKAGRPAKQATADFVTYGLYGVLAMSLEEQQQHCERGACFVLATNVLDLEELTDQEVLSGYKGQVYVERGFRFLKDPSFLASSLFLNKPERIMALLMVMTVCLLVYAALQHRLRQELKEQALTVDDQKGNPTQHPTTRWVFHIFVGIHVLEVLTDTCQSLVLNLRQEHRRILNLLGKDYLALYS
jgi:transposase